MPDVRCLTIHATYRCADSGACCTSGWPIALDASGAADVRAAVSTGTVQTRRLPVFAASVVDGQVLLASDDSGCVLRNRQARRCELHHALGHGALPLACRQFPRVTVHDPRGISVTLSHYCPTAAALLEIDREVAIVRHAPAFPDDAELVGLDATDVLPPLLRDGVLMDWESWWALERAAVELLGNWTGTPAAALARLADAVQVVKRWAPSAPMTLDRAVQDAFASATAGPEHLAVTGPPSRPPDRVVNRFLAAHAFANWTAYGRTGISGWLRSIERAHALIESGLSIREADLRLRHLVETRATG